MGNAEKGQSVELNQIILDIWGEEIPTQGDANPRLGQEPNGFPMTLGYALTQAWHNPTKEEAENEDSVKALSRVALAQSFIKFGGAGKDAPTFQPSFNMDEKTRKDSCDRVLKQWRALPIIHTRVTAMLRLVEA